MMKHVHKPSLSFVYDKHKNELLVSTGVIGYYAYSTVEVKHRRVTVLIINKKGRKPCNQGDMMQLDKKFGHLPPRQKRPHPDIRIY